MGEMGEMSEMACAKIDGIEWQTGFQPLMALNGSAVCDCLMGGAFAIQRPTGAIAILSRKKAKK